jgi:hypothetical protein
MSGSCAMSEDKVCTVESQRVSSGVFAVPYLQGPRARINLSRLHQLGMASANDAEPQRRASGTSVHSAQMAPSQQAELKSKHSTHQLGWCSVFFIKNHVSHYAAYCRCSIRIRKMHVPCKLPPLCNSRQPTKCETDHSTNKKCIIPPTSRDDRH